MSSTPKRAHRRSRRSRRLVSKISVCVLLGVAAAKLGQWIAALHAFLNNESLGRGTYWAITIGWAAMPALAIFVVMPLFRLAGEWIADTLLQMHPGGPSGGWSIGMPNRRLFGRAGRAPELDWSSIAAMLALRLDEDFPPDFHASAGGPEIVVTHGGSVWRVMLSDAGAAPSQKELTVMIGQALDEVRDYVAREGGYAWSPVSSASKPRVEVTPSSLSACYEQLGRPTALLGTPIPLSWKARARRAPTGRARAAPGDGPAESELSHSDPR